MTRLPSSGATIHHILPNARHTFHGFLVRLPCDERYAVTQSLLSSCGTVMPKHLSMITPFVRARQVDAPANDFSLATRFLQTASGTVALSESGSQD